MTKVAIPISKDCLSNYFRECSYYAVFTIKNQKVLAKERIKPAVQAYENYPTWFKEMGITDVLTYKIKPEIIHDFIKQKINVFVGTSQLSPDELVNHFLQGKLKSNQDAL